MGSLMCVVTGSMFCSVGSTFSGDKFITGLMCCKITSKNRKKYGQCEEKKHVTGTQHINPNANDELLDQAMQTINTERQN